jgi:hypothetical protein
MSNLNQAIANQILEYIRPDGAGSLRIDFDNMCAFLLSTKRNFSPAQLERAVQKELEDKIVGKILSPEIFHAIAVFIERMTRYLAYKDLQNEQLRLAKVAEANRERSSRRS